MITFMTTFKPFIGDDEIRQRNALTSWLALADNVQVMVFGIPSAPQDLTDQYHIMNYPEADWKGTGRPTVNEMLRIGERDSQHDVLIYSNGDMVYGYDLLRTILHVSLDRFLLIGQRWDTDFLQPIQEISSEAVERFRNAAVTQGGWRGPSGLDYFVFRRGTYPNIPPLIPGSVVWDNYMIYHSRKECRIPVIDATADILAIHQNHPYKKVVTGAREIEEGPAAINNKVLVYQRHPYFLYTPSTADYASHIIRDGKIMSNRWRVSHIRFLLNVFIIQLLRRTGAYPTVMKILKRKRVDLLPPKQYRRKRDR